MMLLHVHNLNFVIISYDDASRGVVSDLVDHVKGVSVGIKANITLIKL